jgi:alpha-ketoglutarate-dependent 2,4-dichlorophenoxyacetate dioxygenase
LRKTNLDDEGRISLGRQLGELDDITPYLALGRKTRLKHIELFDVSNVEEDGSVVPADSPRAHFGRVRLPI